MSVFTPYSDGAGVRLSCTSSSSRGALVNGTSGDTYQVINMGTDYVALAFGGSTITATTSYVSFGPGTTYLGIPNARGGSAPTYVAGILQGITGTTPAVVQVTVGTLTN